MYLPVLSFFGFANYFYFSNLHGVIYSIGKRNLYFLFQDCACIIDIIFWKNKEPFFVEKLIYFQKIDQWVISYGALKELEIGIKIYPINPKVRTAGSTLLSVIFII